MTDHPPLWPTTLEEARLHRYAVWAKGKGYPYDEGFCPVAVPKGALAFQCSSRSDRRSHPLCRPHAEVLKARPELAARPQVAILEVERQATWTV